MGGKKESCGSKIESTSIYEGKRVSCGPTSNRAVNGAVFRGETLSIIVLATMANKMHARLIWQIFILTYRL